MGEFSVLSLNTFGIPFYLGWERLQRLARELDRMPVSMLCLQEIQQNAYLPLIQKSLSSYPHHIFERHRYAPKGGLAVFSRTPSTHYSFNVYRDRGVWYGISFADWALYKGILRVELELDGLQIVILNTHMNANYTGVWQPANPLAQIQRHQVQQLTQAIRLSPQEALIIVCGDLNFPRSSYLYEELVSPNNLLDPLADDQRTSYRPFPLVPSKWKTSLDYILIHQPRNVDFDVQPDLIPIEDSTRHSPFQRFLTDHNALVIKVCWQRAT